MNRKIEIYDIDNVQYFKLNYLEKEIKDFKKVFKNLVKFAKPKAIWKKFKIDSIKRPDIFFDNKIIHSSYISKKLENSKFIYFFTVTLGNSWEEMESSVKDDIEIYNVHKFGAELVEFFVDLTEERIKLSEKRNHLRFTMRLSPGYGDFSLEYQKMFRDELNFEEIGVKLMDNLLLIPRKTVTAVMGGF